MFRHTLTALRALVVLTVVLGIAYPLAILGIGQAALPAQANGSLVRVDGRAVGSELLGQQFDGDGWFQSRPSAVGYDGGASGGSNLGPDSPDLSTPPASASGLDPHISPEYALLQVDRVAQARGLDATAVRQLVESMIQGRDLGYLGEPTVNVLRLNIALNGLDD